MQWITFATCLTQKNTTLDLVCHTDILCNMWPLGEVLPDKEMSFVTRDHNFTIYFTKMIVIVNQHIKIHSTAC